MTIKFRWRIYVTKIVQSFVTYPLANLSNKETFLQVCSNSESCASELLQTWRKVSSVQRVQCCLSTEQNTKSHTGVLPVVKCLNNRTCNVYYQIYSIEKTCLEDIVVVLKQMLQNYYKVLKTFNVNYL